MVSPRKKILVVEPDEIVLALITHILTRQGYAVDAAGSTAEADGLLRERQYAAALIDATLLGRGMQWPSTLSGRIVILGEVDSDLPIHSMIRKPVEFDVLVQTVADCAKESD